MIYRYAHEFQSLNTDALKELLDIIQTELQERKNEREKNMRKYQEELDELIDKIEHEGLKVEMNRDGVIFVTNN